MKSKKIDAKLVMLEHSKAKVELYTNYLATYLNILSRVPYITKIHIFDLMCGEGIYVDGSKGSPIVTMEKIKDHYYSNDAKCPNIEVWFNDKDKSEIEKEKYKIERVKEHCSKIFRPKNVQIVFSQKDYTHIYPEIISKINSLTKSERLLIFLDPYGYKEIKPSHLRDFLSGGKSELILFLPISFMSRVANKSLSTDVFPGGKPLEEFLTPLIEKQEIHLSSKPYIFIEELKQLLREFLSQHNIFVDTFTIKRDKQNVYCLFFFTSNARGFEKMLDTKWKLDEERGKGFRLNSDQGTLFDEVEVLDYESKLKNYIMEGKTKTNGDLYIFGLDNCFLPKHTNQILAEWQRSNQSFKVLKEDGSEARKGSFYISYKNYGNNPEQIVKFIFE